MSCIIEGPFLNGFAIEYESNNLHINVQDIFGSAVAYAQVSINCQGTIINGMTDRKGCYVGLVSPNVVCDLTITKNCMFNYTQKFMLIDRVTVNDASKNLLLMITDASSNPVTSADVQIQSDIHNLTGQSDVNGLFFTRNEDDFQNTLTISKSGFQTFVHNIPPFLKVNCVDTGFSVASVIVLNV